MAPRAAVLGLLLCVVGVFCTENEYIGKDPRRERTQPSLGIFNGQTASISDFPFTASLEVRRYLYGAAVVVGKKWLLTTGWAVYGYYLNELSFKVGSSSYSKGGQDLKANKVIIHPQYTTGGWDYDIALVKVNKPIKFGKNVKPIKLATEKLKDGDKAWVAGWGEYNSTGIPSKNLLKAQVTVYDWNKCQTVFGKKLTDRLFCTLDKEVAPCNNDFGDPLVVNNVLYGLFAGGYGCEPNANPVLYTDVSSLRDWVESTIKANGEDQE